MFENSVCRSKIERAGNQWSVEDGFKSVKSSWDSHRGKGRSLSGFHEVTYTGNEAKEQQHILQRKPILRRKGLRKTRGTSISNTASSKSPVTLGELADISDTNTRTDSSYSISMEIVAKSIMDYEFLENDNMSLELLGLGSKLMTSIKLPTVITRTKKFRSATLDGVLCYVGG